MHCLPGRWGWSLVFFPDGLWVFFGSVNGLHDIGILVFFGFLGAIACCFMGDKSKPFQAKMQLLAVGCFTGAALFTLVQFARVSGFAGTAVGIWLSFLAGIAGAVVVLVLKSEQPKNKKSLTSWSEWPVAPTLPAWAVQFPYAANRIFLPSLYPLFQLFL